MKPIISIVTVVKNDAIRFQKTASSILSQSSKAFEWIICDGSDQPLEALLGSNHPQISYHRIKDNGIYDAMNQSLAYTNGEWVYFLNAGDQFFEQQTVSKMIDLLIHQKPSLVYGDVIIENHLQKSSWKKAGIFRQINHQSLLAHRDIFKNNLFNTQYQVAADFDWIMRSSQLFDMKKVNIPIAIYEKGGFSEVNYHKVLQERKIIFHDHLKGCSLWLNLLNLKRLQWKAKRNV